MSLTYGFYDSVNHDRKYNAEQLTSIFDGIINDGIFMGYGNAFKVVPGEDDLTVNVETGRAWFNHTWTLNDTLYPLTLEERDVSRPRIDTIALQVDKNTNSRENSLVVVTGKYNGSSPVAPTLSKGTNGIYQYALANVRVKKKGDATKITSGVITDKRGTSGTPWVTGIIDTISVDDLITQWEYTYNEMIDESEAEFDDLLETLKDAVSQATSGTVIDLSVTTPKLAERAVTYAKLEHSSVMIQITNTSVAKSKWVSDSTYLRYPVRASIPIDNVTVGMYCHVDFNYKDSISGIFSPNVVTYKGGIYLYAEEVPKSDITIPTILIYRPCLSSFT
jgi:hypothetical protein